MISESGENAVRVVTQYFEGSNAAGVLYAFAAFTDGDLTTSTLVPVSRNDSLNHILPLSAGQYVISVYDIEENGTLLRGVGYPAVRQELILNGDTRMYVQRQCMC